MYYPIQIQTNEQLIQLCTSPGLPPLDPQAVLHGRPDSSWLLLDPKKDEVAARCSLWWGKTPPYPGQRLGLIGHYAAREELAANQLLHLACQHLAAQGCTLAVGPIDGNTWQRYRLMVERGSHPIFFLEPDHPVDWPIHFMTAGFTALAHYTSALTTNLNRLEPGLLRAAKRAAGRGLQLRSLQVDRLEEELSRIYEISLASFQSNFLYTPIGEADFKALYCPLQPYLRPELILMAEWEEQPAGFIFALPNLLQAQRGQRIDTVIIKTVAVHPAYRATGLGYLLVVRCQEIAAQLGYTQAIHALMHESNPSCRISERYASQTIRRYALFARQL